MEFDDESYSYSLSVSTVLYRRTAATADRLTTTEYRELLLMIHYCYYCTQELLLLQYYSY